MNSDDIRSIAENDQLKEQAYARYVNLLHNRQSDLLTVVDALEDGGPDGVRHLPSDAIDFICDMASVTLRDFAERLCK